MNERARPFQLDQWVLPLLADPVTKKHKNAHAFACHEGVIDARVYLRHTPGFTGWSGGQEFYESWQKRTEADYQGEIEGTVPVYDHLAISGRILDVGGSFGTLRHFLPRESEYLSADPFIDCLAYTSAAMRSAYPCLSKPLNLIGACAEFLPLQADAFDWVHMRSVVDHFHSPDLALLEARRVLKPHGKLVVGLYVDGGKSGRRPPGRAIKEALRPLLVAAGFKRFKDHHVFHPTFEGLKELVADCGFHITDVYWQPQWADQVCYVTAERA
ncbi:MAG TPA: methyltransferase domain-containing protein [Pseudolabrys sp.]|nr:methyltransferase domain-containing protein [Pseudolabrys sp.]